MSKQNNTCRLCLSTNAYINVLKNRDILNNIISHCKVKVEKNDGLPEYICCNCMHRVDDVSKFIEQCCQNDNTLRLQCIENKFIKKDEGVSISIVKDDYDGEAVNHDFPDYTSDFKNEEAFSCSPEKSESASLDNDALMRSVQVAENGEEYVHYLGVKIKITRPTVFKETKKPRGKNLIKKPCGTNLIEKPCEKNLIKKYICPICGLYKPLQHQQLHSIVKKFSCEICKAEFKKKCHLKRHVDRHHSNAKRVECNECEKTFKLKEDLNRHIKYNHSNTPKQHVCHVCDKSFYHKSFLAVHVKTHTGEKKYECAHCDKKCSTRHGIKSHLRIHTKERPFSCKMCPKSFSERGSLRDHVRLHTGEKPHECPICKKGFVQLGNMKKSF